MSLQRQSIWVRLLAFLSCGTTRVSKHQSAAAVDIKAVRA